MTGPGLVSGFSVTPGAGDISSCHFGHSVLWITIDTGDPRVRPWRTPPRNSTSSRSNRMRGPRPKPRRRRASSARSRRRDGRPAGSPSTTTARPGRATPPRYVAQQFASVFAAQRIGRHRSPCPGWKDRSASAPRSCDRTGASGRAPPTKRNSCHLSATRPSSLPPSPGFARSRDRALALAKGHFRPSSRQPTSASRQRASSIVSGHGSHANPKAKQSRCRNASNS